MKYTKLLITSSVIQFEDELDQFGEYISFWLS